jgi:peptidoglycan/xylan/chitin deacetylase (PgdA/CDA1 family)
MTHSNRKNSIPVLLALWCVMGLFPGCQTLNRTRERVPLDAGVVVFTFDDGPNGDVTERLLEVLRKHHVHGAFALLGENVEHNPALAKRIHDEGHAIINHGYGDAFAVHMDGEQFRDNLARGEAALVSALGEAPLPRLYRPQGGFYKKQHATLWRESGYALVPGTARPYDAVLTEKDRNLVVERVIKKIEVEQGGVILLHDGRDSWHKMEARLAKDPHGAFNRSWIPDAVEEIIIILREKGYAIRGYSPGETPCQ